MFEVIFSDTADRQLKKLEMETQKRILSVLGRVRIRPWLYFKRLVGEKAYSLRAGDYRVIADIEKQKLIIFVIKVGHRKNIYKKTW